MMITVMFAAQFAMHVNHLSRGWIRLPDTINFYEANNAKSLIFPSDYDSTSMFWLVNAEVFLVVGQVCYLCSWK